jgi:hypothetical protein
MFDLAIPVINIHKQCEWCGERHAKEALCEKVKRKGMTRRSFLFLGGVGLAAVTLMPDTLIHTPEQIPEFARRRTVFMEVLRGIQAQPNVNPYIAGEQTYQRLLKENPLGFKSLCTPLINVG